MEDALKFSGFMLVSGISYPLTRVVVWALMADERFGDSDSLLSLTLALSTRDKAGPEAQPVFSVMKAASAPLASQERSLVSRVHNGL